MAPPQCCISFERRTAGRFSSGPGRRGGGFALAGAMMLLTLAGIVCGLLLGAAAAVIWTTVLERLGDSPFWSTVASFTKTAVSGDENADFLREYGALLKHLAIYLGRNVLVIGLAFLPVTLFILFVGPAAGRYWNRGADRIVVHPHQTLTVTANGQSWQLNLHLGSFPLPKDPASPLHIKLGDDELVCPSAQENWAFSSSAVRRLLLAALGFETTDAGGQPKLLIVRPWRGGDDNPLEPYLNQMELLFLAALSVASMGGMLYLRARRRWKSKPPTS
jgi:hypothetical protein